MVVYSSYITYVNTRACANGAELAFFEIIFYRERNLTWSGFEPGFDALHTTAFTTEPMGLWHAALDVKFGSYTVECGELLTSVQVRDHGQHQGNPTETQTLQGNPYS